MIRILIAVTVTGAALISASPGQTYNDAPWCLKANVGRDVTEICRFRTFKGCRDERILYGTTAFCVQNHWYLPYWNVHGEKQRRYQ